MRGIVDAACMEKHFFYFLSQGSLPEWKLVASLMASKSSRRKIPISVHTHGEWKYEEGGRRGYVPFGIFFPVANWSQIQLP